MVVGELSIGGIVSEALLLFKGHYKAYLRFVAACLAAMAVIFLLFTGLLAVSGPIGFIIFMPFVLPIIAVIAITVYFAFYGCIIKIASEQILGRQISAGEAWRAVRGKAWTLLFAGLLLTVASMIGLALLVLPGVYLMISCALFIPAAVIEGCGAWDALSRSRELVSGHWWRCFAVFFLTGFLAMALLTVAAFVLKLAIILLLDVGVVAAGLSAFVNFAAQFLFVIFQGIVVTLLYYDLRARKEKLSPEPAADASGGAEASLTEK